jgi:hypothetical protein
MNNSAYAIKLEGISRLELLELQKLLPGDVHHEVAGQPERHGEPLIMAVVVLSSSALGVLASWLVKNRRGVSFEREITIVHKDGSITKEIVKYKNTSSEAPTPAVLEQLSRITGVQASNVLGSDGGAAQ